MIKALALHGARPVRKDRLLFNRPFLGEEEIEAASECIRSGQVSGNGPTSRELERRLCQFLKAKYTLTTTSCTSALELSMMVLNIGRGDEVICPSFTFVSVANAIVRQGARPVFVDIEEETFNIDPEKIKDVVSKTTKAIIPVHYAGAACEMDVIMNIAKERNLKVVEDAAHAIGAKYNGRFLGTIGDIGCFSFHGTKNLVCGEGGAFVCNNPDIYRKAEIIREKGTDRSAFLRGEVDKYTWVSKGSSFVMSDILSAIVIAQLKKIDQIIKLRTQKANYLNQRLKQFEEKIKLPKVKDDCQTNWHIYAIRVPQKKRDWLLKALNAEGINAAFHFVPLHTSPYGKRWLGYKEGDLPVTERVSRELIRLPIYPQMSTEDLDDIVKAMRKVLEFI